MVTRIALYLDVENLVYDRRIAGDWAGATQDLLAIVDAVSRRGTLVCRIACCDPEAARHLAPALAGAGIRTFVHHGGPDAADLVLIRQVEAVPDSCETVVIASGDHIFAAAAADLRRRGKHTAAVAIPGRIAAELYCAVDEFLPLEPATAAA